MNTKTSVNNQSTATAREHYTTGSVTSQDGTTIGYRQFGHGPGVVLLHGAASSAHNHMQLAEALSRAFTVYVPDRRGRGLSGPYREPYSLQVEVEDLEALLAGEPGARIERDLAHGPEVLGQGTRPRRRLLAGP